MDLSAADVLLIVSEAAATPPILIFRFPSNVARGLVATAVLLAITLISIPFAWAHLKLAGLALWPIGLIVPTQEASLRHAGAGDSIVDPCVVR